MLLVRAYEEGAQRLSIWRWYEQLFRVCDAKLRGARDICTRIGRKVSGIDDLTVPLV